MIALRFFAIFIALLISHHSFSAFEYNFYVYNQTKYKVNYFLSIIDKDGTRSGALEPGAVTTIKTPWTCLQGASAAVVAEDRSTVTPGKAYVGMICGDRNIKINESNNQITVSIENP